MTIQPGTDLSWLRPADQRGETLGCHIGTYEALNVRNAVPGRKYYWGNKRKLLHLYNEGWRPVGADDPEEFGAMLPDDVGAPLDSALAFDDVVLLWTTEENYARLRAERNQRAEDAREAATLAYLEQGETMNQTPGAHARPGEDLYFRRPGHRVQFSDRFDRE